MALSGIVYRWSRVDRHSRLLQRRGTNHVPLVDACASVVHVSIGAARRHGDRQRTLGRGGRETRRPGWVSMVSAGHDRRTIHDPAAPADRSRTRNGSGCRSRLMIHGGPMKTKAALITLLLMAGVMAHAAAPGEERRTA